MHLSALLLLSMKQQWWLLFLALSSSSWVAPVRGIVVGLQVPGLKRKCLGSDLLSGTLLVVQAFPTNTADVDMELSLSHAGEILWKEDSQSGPLATAWTATATGTHQVCLANFSHDLLTVTLDIRQGPEAKDYSQVAKKEHLTPFVLQLRRIEDQLRSYHKNLLFLRSREVHYGQVNDAATHRSLLFCVVGVLAFLGATLAEVAYFKHFLRSRKVI